MRVMHVIDELGVGGAERSLVELARGAVQSGAQVSVCLTRGQDPPAWELPEGVPVERLRRGSRWQLSSAKRFHEALSRRQPHILHLHGRSSLAFAAAAQSLGVPTPPLLLHDHDGDGSRRAWVLRAARRRLARYVASSPALRARANRRRRPPSSGS